MNEKYLIPKKDLTIYFIISIFYMVFDLISTGKLHICCLLLLYLIYIALMYLPVILAIIFNSIVRSSIIKKEKIIKVLKILFNVFTVVWYALYGFLVYFGYCMSKAFDYVEYDGLESFIIPFIV